jgi:hypothetical protein
VPQLVPAGSGPVSVHVWFPAKSHAVVPLSQAFVGVQERFAMHVLQTPEPLQTWFVPQLVPAGRGPVSTQTGAPVEQEIVPLSHVFVGGQAAPAVQELQLPVPLQTRFVPQLVPAASGVPVSVHVCVPVEQSVKPASQGFAGVHERPAVHELHVPFEQTRFVPQLVPFARAIPESTQTVAPVEQSVVPVWHGFVGVQATPAVHALHVPL